MNERPTYYHDVETCVEQTLSKVGRRIALGTPLGLGKANHLVNEFFRRANEDSSMAEKRRVVCPHCQRILSPRERGFIDRSAYLYCAHPCPASLEERT